MVHAFSYFGGVTATVLKDNMKTVVLDRVDGPAALSRQAVGLRQLLRLRAAACHPYRPQTKGKIESTIRYIKSSFWPGLSFDSLAELNRQALTWCGEANHRVHATTREVPAERFAREELVPLNGQPAYDTSYVSHRLVAKDCMLAYRGNRYSVPHAYAGKSVVVREPLESGRIRIFHQQDMIAEHALSEVKGEMVIEPAHYASLPRKSRPAISKPAPTISELTPGPGVGLHYIVPEVEFRSLAIYEEVAYVASV